MCIIFPAPYVPYMNKKKNSGNPVNKENLSLFFHVMIGARKGAAIFFFFVRL